MKPSISAFLEQTNRLYGLYLDSTMGFGYVRKNVIEMQRQNIAKLLVRGEDRFANERYLDQQGFIFGKGPPDSKSAKTLHVATQGEMKSRNEKGGANYIAAGQSAIVTLYSYWEDVYRCDFAADIGEKKENILAPIMGDLRYLRISIVHHAGIAKKEVERCTTLNWFKEGDSIELNANQMELAFDKVASFCVDFDANPSKYTDRLTS